MKKILKRLLIVALFTSLFVPHVLLSGVIMLIVGVTEFIIKGNDDFTWKLADLLFITVSDTVIKWCNN